MKSKALLVFFALFIQSHAFAFSEFIGEFDYVSGPRGTIGCGDMSVRPNQLGDGLEVYFKFSNGDEPVVAYEFPSINKGKVDWIYDWGDGIARGKQDIRYANSEITKVITQFGGFLKIRTDKMAISNDVLVIDSSSRDHQTKCVLQRK